MSGEAVSAYEVPRLKTQYNDEIRTKLQEEFGYKNVNQIPKVTKVVVNIGLGEALENARAIESATEDLKVITGQRPVVTRAKRAVSNFKLREGNPIGLKLTLRGERMWEFYDRLVSLAIPRIRDFRGLSPRSFDGHGNYTFGVTEQLIFPEISYDSVNKIRGMDVTIVTSATNDEHGRALLTALGFPFRTEGQN